MHNPLLCAGRLLAASLDASANPAYVGDISHVVDATEAST
jgi:hypothetical protein